MKDFTIELVDGPCRRCGSDDVQMGWVRDSHSHRLNFELEPRTEGDRLAGKGRGLISGRVCRACRFIELFAEALEYDEA